MFKIISFMIIVLALLTNNAIATDLHDAVKKGDIETVLALIKAGADIDARNQDDESPAQVAVKKGHSELARMIEAAGVKQ